MSFDINLLRITITLVSFIAFIGVIVYAIHPVNRSRFSTAAELPPDENGL